MAKWTLKKGVTWREKLETPHPSHGKIVMISPAMRKRFGEGTMVIPRPLDVDAMMRKARKGRLITVTQIRTALAVACGVDQTCPMTTGIFVRIAAEAAEEAAREGRKRITPYWRTIKADGSLNEKFPGGVRAQAAKLRQDGHSIAAAKGKKPPKVKDFEKRLVRL